MLHSEGLKRTSAPDFLMSNLHVKKFWNHAKTHVEDTFQRSTRIRPFSNHAFDANFRDVQVEHLGFVFCIFILRITDTVLINSPRVPLLMPLIFVICFLRVLPTFWSDELDRSQ